MPQAEFILPVASSLDQNWMQHQISQSKVRIHLVLDARAALFLSRAAIVASGTATVEAALMGTPFVMIYRVSPLTYAIGRRMVKLTRYGMVNLIAGRDVVPEFVQHEFVPSAVAESLKQLILNTSERERMLNDLAEVRRKLHPHGQITAAERAANAVLQVSGH
jgi:lipid-A-disaccharide synthase